MRSISASIVAAVAHHVQHRAEHLLAQRLDGVDLERHRRDVRGGKRVVDAGNAPAGRASRSSRCTWRVRLACASASITGPTSVARSCGVADAQLAHRAGQHLEQRRRRSHSCTHSRRSAEQRWPAERNALCTTASTTCSGSAVESTTIAFRPPVSAISGTIGPSDAASARWMCLATCGRAGEAHARAQRDARPVARPRISPGPCSSASASRGTPASCSSSTKACATPGVCSAGLAATAVAGHQGRNHLAGEDRERKVPRRDAHEHAAPVQAQLVALAGGAGQLHRREPRARLERVVAAEVDRFAHLRHAVAPGLASFGHQQRAELRQPRLQPFGCQLEDVGALLHRPCIPAGPAGAQPLHRCADARRRRLRAPPARSLADHAASSGSRWSRQARSMPCGLMRAGPYRLRGSGWPGAGTTPQRRLQQLVGRHAGVGQLVHERRVRAVLQQPAHEVGEQVAVFAHRRVDAQVQPGRRRQHLAVHALAHAVQALQLERRIVRRAPSARWPRSCRRCGWRTAAGSRRGAPAACAPRRGRRCRCAACA